MNDPMEKSTILGAAEDGSVSGMRRIDAHKKALDAYERADIDAMFAAYRTAVDERATAEKTWFDTVRLIHAKELKVDPVECIRDVALAAIAMAEKIATNCIPSDPS